MIQKNNINFINKFYKLIKFDLTNLIIILE